MFDFSGKNVLITGASYGLGEQFAKDFAQAGANLVVTARGEEQLKELAKSCESIGSKVVAVPGDVSIEQDVNRVISEGIKELGHIDVLINNAGIADPRGVCPEQYDSETFNNLSLIHI